MKLCYVAIGSNLGPSQATAQSALEALQAHAAIADLTLSHWYQSQAIGGPIEQPDYLNAVCCFKTSKSPLALLELLQTLENQHGRTRAVRWGPRTLDLDIIWIEDFNSDSPELTVPHPRAHQRAFVLLPLKDLNAPFKLNGQTIEALIALHANQEIQRLPSYLDKTKST